MKEFTGVFILKEQKGEKYEHRNIARGIRRLESLPEPDGTNDQQTKSNWIQNKNRPPSRTQERISKENQ